METSLQVVVIQTIALVSVNFQIKIVVMIALMFSPIANVNICKVLIVFSPLII